MGEEKEEGMETATLKTYPIYQVEPSVTQIPLLVTRDIDFIDPRQKMCSNLRNYLLWDRTVPDKFRQHKFFAEAETILLTWINF